MTARDDAGQYSWSTGSASTQKSGQAPPGPATSPTASAISFLPTVQQRGRVGHLQSPRHRTISWNGVYQDESAASGPPFQRNGQYGHASHMTLGDGSASFGLRVLRPRGMQTRFLPRLLFLMVWALRRTRPWARLSGMAVQFGWRLAPVVALVCLFYVSATRVLVSHKRRSAMFCPAPFSIQLPGP